MRRHLYRRNIGGLDSDGSRQVLQIAEELILGDLAASPFHFGEIGQDEILRQSMLNWVEGSHLFWLPIGQSPRYLPSQRAQRSSLPKTVLGPCKHSSDKNIFVELEIGGR